MRAREFDRRLITPETNALVWFIIHEESAMRAIKQKFGKVIKECGGALNVPGKYWSLIENLAYTSGGEAEIVPMPKKCAEKVMLNIQKTPVTIDTANKKITFESHESLRKKMIDAIKKFKELKATLDEAEEDVLTGQFDLAVDKLNDAGAGVEAHTQIDNYIQQAMAPKKPIQNVPMP